VPVEIRAVLAIEHVLAPAAIDVALAPVG